MHKQSQGFCPTTHTVNIIHFDICVGLLVSLRPIVSKMNTLTENDKGVFIKQNEERVKSMHLSPRYAAKPDVKSKERHIAYISTLAALRQSR